jgi:exosome complex component CSL4
MLSKKLKDRPVLPGDKLAVIEVLQSGPGAYQIGGEVRSEELGDAHFDLKERRVEVRKKTPKLNLPVEGVDVVAEVGSVMRRYSRDMTMAMRNGDTIKAKIINTKNRMVQLSVQGPEYGVIYAHCTRCGTILELQNGRLQCSKCDRSERRKFASTYGKEDLT